MTEPHVVIIGAGFAGLRAARELESAGISCEIIEARDRVGGRAWTDERMGRNIELGATWVHWFQTHVWQEITRYQQPLVASPAPEQVYWNSQDTTHQGTLQDLDRTIQPPMAEIFARSEQYFPHPYDPLWILSEDFDGPAELREQFLADDQASVLDAVRASGNFTQEQIDLVDAYWSAGYVGSPHTGSALMAKHWVSLSDHRLRLLDDITLKYKLVNGMKALYEPMAAELNCPIRLNTPVTAVDHDGHSARVTLATGEVREASAVIVTVPVGALRTIRFTPELPETITATIEQGWNTSGAKIWFKVKGRHKLLAYAPYPAPMACIRSEYFTPEGDTILVGFGPEASAVDLESTADAQRILDYWRDDLEVVESTGHDWQNDPWSGQAWGTLRTGQFTDAWHHFERLEPPVVFAGSELARGWRGVCVDGALESGLTTARKLITHLGS
ncbi:NAD(P)/FAD-dependent oxidoreductase [Auritidibacter ignavus]|uniref:flavin monoamine oxidase family protein n=1 Tax=Auritidibacter ignavus TaxID=678932 RepID=UPI00244C53E1|nr:NAD(P)/FAD-dependent oxidoreductase [Auritidibacter ignavus]WGH81174.1 NAD(P)/FAD-dependent oxidoreductase [Auritidibacter ignavus]WGH90384.1 NAD(P)/FAD-dependent oxidoreductase [Auritidibacter ignavus]